MIYIDDAGVVDFFAISPFSHTSPLTHTKRTHNTHARAHTGPLSIPSSTSGGAGIGAGDALSGFGGDPSIPVPEAPFYDRLDAYADFDPSARNLWLYVDEGGCVRALYMCL